MTKQEIYQSKLGTLQGALDLIKSGDTIATPIYGCEPSSFLSELHTIGPRVNDVALWTMIMMGDYEVMTDDSLKDHIDIYTFFFNKDCRKGHSSGRFHFCPMDLHEAANGVLHVRKPNVFVAGVSPMDENGFVYMSYDLEVTLEELEAADTVIFEINESIPRVYGETAVPIEKADYIYEVSNPLGICPVPAFTETDRKIANNILSLIQDGDCIQLGIGSMPNAVGEGLLSFRHLGIHTEMLTTSMGKLLIEGAADNSCKNFNHGKTVAAFAWGNQALYDYMADNDSIMMRRAAYVNNPANIAKNDNMVSINTAIQVDLSGQICSESIGSKQFSGTGGALDFAYGAFHSKGGRGIIALASTTKNDTVSKIQPFLTTGAAVSIPRNTCDYVVTEFGIAHLRGKTLRERVESLISISHPKFRDELRQKANEYMLW